MLSHQWLLLFSVTFGTISSTVTASMKASSSDWKVSCSAKGNSLKLGPFAKPERKYQSSVPLAFCERNPPVTGGFPSQRAINAENVSMSWRHREWDKKAKIYLYIFDEMQGYLFIFFQMNRRYTRVPIACVSRSCSTTDILHVCTWTSWFWRVLSR